MTAVSRWNEAQVVNFVAYATADKQELPEDNWRELYAQGLALLHSAGRGIYADSELKFISMTAHRNAKHPENLPSLGTLLRISSIQSVSLVELIRAPVECCSPRLMNVEGARDPGKERHNKLPDEWNSVRAVVENLMADETHLLLPTKRKLLRRMGLSVSGLWQHFPELAVSYERERLRRDGISRAAKLERAIVAAQELAQAKRRTNEDIQIRRDGVALMQEIGVSKAAAEQAIRIALAAQGKKKARNECP